MSYQTPLVHFGLGSLLGNGDEGFPVVDPPEMLTGEDVFSDDPPSGLPGGVEPFGQNHVPPRPNNWDVEAKPHATYKLAMGDTLAGLAVTYLGDGTRWKEIWDTGSNRSRMPNPDFIDKPITLDMPDEARDNLVAWLKKGKPSNQKPGAITPAERKSLDNRSRNIAIGAGVVALLGAAYLLRG